MADKLGACLSLLMSKPSSAQAEGGKMRSTSAQPVDQAGAHDTSQRGHSN